MDLLFLLNQASYALGNEMATRLAEVGISPRHYCVLTNARGQDLTQIRLAERSMLDKTTMVVTLDELERQGLLERRPSPADRRVKVIAVTPEGEQAIDRAQGIVERMQADILESLPEDRRAAFTKALGDLVDGPLASPSHVQRRPRARALVAS